MRSAVRVESPGTRYLFPTLMLALVVFFNFLARMVFSPLLPVIEGELGITHGQSGTFFLLITLGYSVAILLSGFLSARIHHRGVITVSLTAVGLVLLFLSTARSLLQMRLGMVVLGMSAGLYSPSGIATLTHTVARRNWGKAIAIHDLGPNLAFVLAPAMTTIFVAGVGWRPLLVTLSFLSMATAAIFFVFSRQGRFPGQPPHLGNVKAILSQRSFWILSFFFMIGVTSAIGVFAVVPSYLTAERGMGQSLANSLVSVSRLTVLPAILLSGWLRDRLGERILIGGVMAITGSLNLLLGIAPSALLPAVVILQPTVLAALFPAVFAAIAGIGPPETRNVVVSLMVPACYIFGGGIFPAIMGILGDHGLFFLGFVVMGLATLASLLFLRFLSVTPGRTIPAPTTPG